MSSYQKINKANHSVFLVLLCILFLSEKCYSNDYILFSLKVIHQNNSQNIVIMEVIPLPSTIIFS